MALTQRYKLRQPWLAEITERSLAPELMVAISGGIARSEAFARPHPGVVEFPLFSTEYTQALLRELHAFEHWCSRTQSSPTRPNSMNRYGVVLSELGLEDAMDELLYKWLLPVTSAFFPDHAGEHLDYQHAFVVDYAEQGDTALGFHVDDSEVTLNACLGFEFEGSEVYFRGERCDDHRSDAANDGESWQWAPSPGRAILHAGANRHGVLPLQVGRRVNLILWARSTRHRRVHPIPHQGPAAWCTGCKTAA